MAATLTPSPLMQFFDNAGNFLVGGKLYSYAAGTTTPLATYTNESGNVANTNPVILNSRGEAAVWLGSTNQYKFILKDANDVLIWTADNISASATQSDFTNLKALYAGSTGSSLIGYLPSGTGAVATTVQTKLRESVSLKDFGAVGDYTTDDTSAFSAFLTYLNSSKKSGYIPSGVYRITTSIDLPSGVKLFGDGPPGINTWFDTPDKQNLRPGFKNLISGSVLIFDGTATNTYTTNRTDKFASFTYALSYLHIAPCLIENIGIVQDMDVYTAANVLTTLANVNAADYDCGLVLRSQLSVLNNVNIFGYWPNGSFIVNSQQNLENIDSDYNRAIECLFTTVSLVGDETGANGLTGFMGTNCGYYSAADFHTSSQGDYTIPSIFVDGYITGIPTGGIRGHRFHGNLRTRTNAAVQLGYCDEVVFEITSETPALAGVPNADAQGYFQGQPYTGDVRIIALANANNVNMQQLRLGNVIGGSLISVGGQEDANFTTTFNGKPVNLGVEKATGDSYLQLGNSPLVTNSGWFFRNDVSEDNNMSVRYNNSTHLIVSSYGVTQAALANRAQTSTVVINSGVARCAINRGWFEIDTQGSAATDDLDSILPAIVLSTESAVVTFKNLTAGQTVTVAGLTYTSTGATTAAFVAYAFANITAGSTPPINLPYGTFSGTLTAFDSGRANQGSADITFTSTTPSTAVADIVVTSTGTAPTVVITQGGVDITPTYEIGQQMFLKTVNTSRDVVFKNLTGNIICDGAADFTLTSTITHASCVFDGSFWRCTKFTG